MTDTMVIGSPSGISRIHATPALLTNSVIHTAGPRFWPHTRVSSVTPLAYAPPNRPASADAQRRPFRGGLSHHRHRRLTNRPWSCSSRKKGSRGSPPAKQLVRRVIRRLDHTTAQRLPLIEHAPTLSKLKTAPHSTADNAGLLGSTWLCRNRFPMLPRAFAAAPSPHGLTEAIGGRQRRIPHLRMANAPASTAARRRCAGIFSGDHTVANGADRQYHRGR